MEHLLNTKVLLFYTNIENAQSIQTVTLILSKATSQKSTSRPNDTPTFAGNIHNAS